MKILVLAGVLLVLALASFFHAMLLVPTELGHTWMFGGFVLFAASALALAIRFATEQLERALRKGGAPTDAATMRIEPEAASGTEGPVLRADPDFARPGDTPANAASKGPSLGMIAAAAGAVAAGTTAIGASALAAQGNAPSEQETSVFTPSIETPDMPPDTMQVALVPDIDHRPVAEDPLIAELERDIFAEFPILAGKRSVAPSAGDPVTDDADILEAPVPPARPEDGAGRDVEARTADESPEQENDPEAASKLSDDAFDAVLAEAGPVAPTVQGTSNDEDDRQEAPATHVPDMREKDPLHIPGLIADQDLAALEAEEAPLAPLASLDVVGAYDSGGTRFTMYSDGSVTASGPTLEKRFPSLDALRAYIDSGEKA